MHLTVILDLAAVDDVGEQVLEARLGERLAAAVVSFPLPGVPRGFRVSPHRTALRTLAPPRLPLRRPLGTGGRSAHFAHGADQPQARAAAVQSPAGALLLHRKLAAQAGLA